MTTAKEAVKAAKDSAQEAKKGSREPAEKIAAPGAAFSLYREQVARGYIHREVMR